MSQEKRGPTRAWERAKGSLTRADSWLSAKEDWLKARGVVKLLQTLGSLSIVIAAASYLAECDDRRDARDVAAWDVVMASAGKPGGGGRVQALETLNSQHVALAALDLTAAVLNHACLPFAMLFGAQMNDVILIDADLRFASLGFAQARRGNFLVAKLDFANLSYADLREAQFGWATMREANLYKADLRGARLGRGIQTAHVLGANVSGARFYSPEIKQWVLTHGAVEIADSSAWNLLRESAALPETTRVAINSKPVRRSAERCVKERTGRPDVAGTSNP